MGFCCSHRSFECLLLHWPGWTRQSEPAMRTLQISTNLVELTSLSISSSSPQFANKYRARTSSCTWQQEQKARKLAPTGLAPTNLSDSSCAMSPIFQVDNVCVLRHQRILLGHRHVFKQSVIERSVLRRQKPGTVFRQKWHCRHLNKNLKLTFFHCHFPARNISPYWCTVTGMLLHLFT